LLCIIFLLLLLTMSSRTPITDFPENIL